MNIIVFIALVESYLSFFLGLFIFIKHPKKNLNIIFMLYCFSFSILGFSDFMKRIVNDHSLAYFYSKFYPGFSLSASFLLHFCLILTINLKKSKARFFSPLIYLPSLIFIYLSITTNLFVENVVRNDWGWILIYPEYSAIIDYYYLWVFFLGISSMILCLRKYSNSSDLTEKLQLKNIIYGIISLAIMLTLFDLIFPYILQIELPASRSSGFSISCVFIAFAIWKYELFGLDLISVVVNVSRNLSDAVILTSPNNKIIAVNQITLKIFKYQEDELIDNPVNILFSEEKDKLFNIKDQILRSHEIKNSATETFFNTKIGKKIPVSLSISLIRDKKGELHGIVYLVRDITERKILENKFKKALKEQKLYIDNIIKASQYKTNFLSSMSHDLRTPLNAIIGFSDLLLDESYGNLNEDQIDFLNDIKSSSDHLLELIDHVLDISKIESGELKLNLQNFELNALIDEIKSVVKPLYNKKGLYLKVEGLNAPKIIYADLVRLKEIFYNLLSNAIKYTIKGGIILQIIEDNNRWKFNVIDTGIGIAKENYELIFKEYKRIESLYVSSTLGTGLGLSLAKKLVNLHGGEMYFTSKFGEGSTFTFTIPKNPIQ